MVLSVAAELNGSVVALRKCLAGLVHVMFTASLIAVFKQGSDLFCGTTFGTLLWAEIDIGWLLAVFFPIFAAFEAFVYLPLSKKWHSIFVPVWCCLPSACFFLNSVNWQALDKDWSFLETSCTNVEGGKIITSEFVSGRGNWNYSDCCLFYDQQFLFENLLFRRCLRRGYDKEIHVLKVNGRKIDIHIASSKTTETIDF